MRWGLRVAARWWLDSAPPNPDSIRREAQRFSDMGLVKGKHFTMKMPEGGRDGHVYIRREGLAYAVWLSVHGS